MSSQTDEEPVPVLFCPFLPSAAIRRFRSRLVPSRAVPARGHLRPSAPAPNHGRSAVAATVSLVLAAGASAACSERGAAASGCTDIAIAAAPVIAPAIEKTAQRLAAERREGSGVCVRARVVRQDSRDVAESLAGDGADAATPRPDVWIPDSSLWIPKARTSARGAHAVNPSGRSIARSPLVLAMPERAVAKLTSDAPAGPQGSTVPTNWGLLLAGALTGTAQLQGQPVKVGFTDPARTASGLGALLLAHRFAGSGKNGLTGFTVATYTHARAPIVSEAEAYEAMAASAGSKTPAAFVLSEQSVWAHRTAEDDQAVTALYPVEGSLDLDFPYVLTTTDPARKKAAEAIRTALGRPAARTALHDQGLRTPDGATRLDFDDDGTVQATVPKALPLQDATTIARIGQMWQRIVLGARMSVLLDVSPSMNQVVPDSGGLTRMQLTLNTGADGLRLFSDRTRTSLWLFSTDLDDGKDYREAVPLRRLNTRVGDTTQRDLLLQEYAQVKPVAGTRTALYNTVRDAFRAAVKDYSPDQHNIVVVLTDGANYNPGRSISLNTLVDTLRREWDADRPVSVIPVAFGPDIEPAALKKIAEATRSEAFVTRNPRDIQKVFLQMLIRVTCGDECPIES